MIDMASARRQIMAGLPRSSQWLIAGSPLEYDFWAGERENWPLVALADGSQLGDSMEIIGQQVFAKGGGSRVFIGINRETGEVIGYDPEINGDPWLYFSSSVGSFVQVFGMVAEAVRDGLVKAAVFRARIQDIEPGYSQSEWSKMIDTLEE